MPTNRAELEGLERSLLVLMGVLLVGASVALLDTTIVAVSIGDLTRAFGTTVQVAQWATTAYLLAMAAVIPMMGWLTDRWGSRRIWLVTLWVFLAGSILCGLAWSIESLIAFRIIQGLGAGLILPLVQAMLAGAAGPGRIGRVMGLVGIPGQLAPILGPVLGGIILSSWGWRWIFMINIPLCLIAILLAHRFLHPVDVRRSSELDWSGALLIIPATVAILAGLSIVGDPTISATLPIALLAVGAVLVTAFVGHARRRADRALLDLRLLGHRSFAVATVMMFLSGVCLYGPMLLLPLFYQQARGLPVATVGWLLAPQGLGLMAALWIAGRGTDRIGPRIVALTGVLLAGAGIGVFVVAGGGSLILLSAGLVALGAGLGSIGVAVSATSYRDVDPASIPRATSLLTVIQRIGASFGTVVVALVLRLQLAAGPGDIGVAFAHAFGWTLGFLGLAGVVVLLLPAGPVPAPRIRIPETRSTP